MKLHHKYPVLGSSVDSSKLSATIKSLIPLAVLLAVKFGLDIEATELDNLITTVFVAVNACASVYYAGRKIYVKIR